ncbi:hypothetical protein [Williamwhitmania taraxaci]|uniref:Uncharacterized protein n=1 Tax=Williamwhitmania taraxaci TaxID=1640674 RepID=A0A1G6KJR1_9BACT|nr:hypothetical protein [Williamwhitmania taraxaci]SDC30556.1 hypothetical protein SAMN05216323_102512 [Williamwhitmania taraxaci]
MGMLLGVFETFILSKNIKSAILSTRTDCLFVNQFDKERPLLYFCPNNSAFHTDNVSVYAFGWMRDLSNFEKMIVMNTVEIRKNFHNLIDRIDNDIVLSRFYEILEKASVVKDGSLWDRLTSEEKQELLQIDSETDLDNNLIPLQTIKDKHKKWLE